jgi:hypothetical protein
MSTQNVSPTRPLENVTISSWQSAALSREPSWLFFTPVGIADCERVGAAHNGMPIGGQFRLHVGTAFLVSECENDLFTANVLTRWHPKQIRCPPLLEPDPTTNVWPKVKGFPISDHWVDAHQVGRHG